MPAKVHPFEVDIGSLIEVLRDNLYSDPYVALREVLANARDSLLRRWGTSPGSEARIEVRLGDADRTFTVRDNGIGMDEEEVQYGMARVAGSFTRLVRRGVVQKDDVGDWVSGSFGLGFFASFMLAHGVEVRTRRPDRGSPGLLWRCFGGREQEAGQTRIPASWTLEETDWNDEGTEVTLYLKPDFCRELMYPAGVEPLLRRFVDLIEFPVLLSGCASPVNAPPPWLDDTAPREYWLEYFRRRGLLKEGQEVLTLVPVREKEFRGGLFLPKSPSESGTIELHVRHILVGQTETCIEPSMSFVHGIIDHDSLPLPLSREAVLPGPELQRLQSQLRTVFLDHLKSLADSRQADLSAIVRTYGRRLKHAAIEDDRLLGILGPLFSVPVGLHAQPTYLADLVHDHPQVVYMDDPAAQGQYAALWEAAGSAVVNASDHLDRMLIHRYADHCGKEATRADTQPRIDELHEHGWEDVEHLIGLHAPDAQVKQAALPDTVTALFEHNFQDELADMLREAVRTGRDLPDEIREIAEFQDRMHALQQRRRGLFINVRHPLLKALRTAITQGEDPEFLVSSVKALVAIARLQTERVDAPERAKAFALQGHALAALLRELTGRPKVGQAGTNPL